MAMKIKLWELSYHEVVQALKHIDPVHEVEIVEEVMITEANVLLCKFKGKRFNIYFDIDYGAEIKAVDKIEQEELKMMEELIIRQFS
ncbi:hypothetical protein [Chitinophaga sp. ARDCPP14]|uniref:hypothetical protein n=1 Tax=Chitinophaga sp. ARDCPP14 TaxID=3391139 RepID=UPI003F522133